MRSPRLLRTAHECVLELADDQGGVVDDSLPAEMHQLVPGFLSRSSWLRAAAESSYLIAPSAAPARRKQGHLRRAHSPVLSEFVLSGL
jgi:hypothetical protein